MAWLNNDGLRVLFDKEQGQPGRAGEYNLLGPVKMVEVAIDLTDLNTSASTLLSPTVTLPEGAFVEKVEVVVTEVTDSADDTANLDLGFQKLDGTAYDEDGLLAAADGWHAAAVGTVTTYVAGTSEAGDDYGVALTEPVRLVAKADTQVYTTGSLNVRIYYQKPVAAPNL